MTCDGTSAGTFSLGGRIGVGTIGKGTVTVDIYCCLTSPYGKMDCVHQNISSRLVPNSWMWSAVLLYLKYQIPLLFQERQCWLCGPTWQQITGFWRSSLPFSVLMFPRWILARKALLPWIKESTLLLWTCVLKELYPGFPLPLGFPLLLPPGVPPPLPLGLPPPPLPPPGLQSPPTAGWPFAWAFPALQNYASKTGTL